MRVGVSQSFPFSDGLVVLLLLCATGCSHRAVSNERLPYEGNLGIIAILSDSSKDPEFRYITPIKGDFKDVVWHGVINGKKTGRHAGKVLAEPLYKGAKTFLEPPSLGSGYELPFALVLFLTAATIQTTATGAGVMVGGVQGIVEGIVHPSQEKIEQQEAALLQAIAELNLQKAINTHLLLVANEKLPHGHVVVHPDQRSVEDERRGGAGADTADSIDTTLKTNVTKVGLIGNEESTNPGLRLFIQVETQLIRKDSYYSGGHVVDERLFECRSGERTFSSWSSNQAENFRDELGHCYKSLGQQMARELLGAQIPIEFHIEN